MRLVSSAPLPGKGPPPSCFLMRCPYLTRLMITSAALVGPSKGCQTQILGRRGEWRCGPFEVEPALRPLRSKPRPTRAPGWEAPVVAPR
jgi:hypothetical protein